MLSGEGADEVFAGYDLYRYMQVLELYRRTIGRAAQVDCANRATMSAGYEQDPQVPFPRIRSAGDALKGISAHEEHYKETLYRRDFADHIASCQERPVLVGFLDRLFASDGNGDPLRRMLFFDTKTWLPDDLLIKADRMSMAASLELRVPFLDYRLVEFAAKMPSRYKINGSTHKFLLKEMMKDILPGRGSFSQEDGLSNAIEGHVGESLARLLPRRLTVRFGEDLRLHAARPSAIAIDGTLQRSK